MTKHSLDTCLTLVSDRYRRQTLQRLRAEPDGTTTVDDLVNALHSSETITVGDRRTDRERIRVQLVHKHLPKLAGHGVVDFDQERETVRYRPDQGVEAVLDSLPEEVAKITP